jgi:signal transduction histidine kinase
MAWWCAGWLWLWSLGQANAATEAPPSHFTRFFYTSNICAWYGQEEVCRIFEQGMAWYAHQKNLPFPRKIRTQQLKQLAKKWVALQWNGQHVHFPVAREHLYFQTITLLGSKAAENGDYQKAARYLLRAEQMAKDIYWPYFEGLMHNHLGILYYSEQAYEKAAYHFHAALRNMLQSNEGWDEPHWVQNILNNIGLCYYKQNLEAPALSSFKRAYQIAYQTGNQRGMAYAYINWVNALWAFSPQELSEEMVQKMLDHAQKSEIDIFMGRAVVVGAMVYHAKGEKLKAYGLLTSINPERSLHREFRYQRNYYQQLAGYAKDRGDFKSAYVFTLKEASAADSMDQIYQRKLLQMEHVKQDMIQATNHAEDIRFHIQAKSLQGKLWFGFGLLLFVVIMVIFLLWLSLRKRYAKFKTVSEGLKTQNQQLHRTHRHLELTDKHKSYILGTVAHDLRNVLGNVTQVSDLLLDTEDGKLFTKENQHLMHLLGHSAKIGLFTLQDLSDAIRPDPHMQLHLRIMLPHQVIEEAQKLLFSKLKRKQMALKIDHQARFLMACDQDKTVRAITNVLDNAIKFSPPGRDIHCTIYQTADQTTIFRIRDFGKGIPEALRPSIFHAFSSGARGTLGETSTGLGLYIVKKIMMAHGGKVWVKTAEGKGTAFYLAFPPPKIQQSMGQIYPNQG